jgi:archaetidylinositol phosphate synthase
MRVSAEPPGIHAPAEARRAGREVVLELVFRPLSNVLVLPLSRARVPAPLVVLANAATGLVAALLLARGELLTAAVLLQVKTLLDNTDGQLARATGQVTLAGRYLDTLCDLVVNAAVFVALGNVTGQPLLALAAFVALTLVLAADFNATELYREAQGTPTWQPAPSGGVAERTLESVYRYLFGRLDRAFRSLLEHMEPDRLMITVLANLGLSTQLLVLGVCLAAERPAAYVWLVLASLPVVVGLLVRRNRRGPVL